MSTAPPPATRAALRNRAKVDADYNKTVAATNMAEEAKGDRGAYSHGALISPLLYNVRRERRNELCAEALRMMDLRRRCALDQMINTPIRSRVSSIGAPFTTTPTALWP